MSADESLFQKALAIAAALYVQECGPAVNDIFYLSKPMNALAQAIMVENSK